MILIGRGLDLAQVLKKRSIGRKERSVGESFHVQLSGCGKAAKSARLSKRSKQATQSSAASRIGRTQQSRHQTSSQFPVVMTRGSHLFPSRTQKLSLSVPMVLGWTRPGRVGRCRIPHGKLERASLFHCMRTPLQSSLADIRSSLRPHSQAGSLFHGMKRSAVCCFAHATGCGDSSSAAGCFAALTNRSPHAIIWVSKELGASR